jgi:hypothetical protein
MLRLKIRIMMIKINVPMQRILQSSRDIDSQISYIIIGLSDLVKKIDLRRFCFLIYLNNVHHRISNEKTQV